MRKLVKIIFISIYSTLFGCSDFLDVEVPKDQVDQLKAFSNDAMATSALTHAYSALRNKGFFAGDSNGAGVLLGCYTDELESLSVSMVSYRYFYEGNLVSSNEAVKDLWNQTFQQIYIVNNVIEGLSKSEGVSKAVKEQLTGEALAIRGILHFYLAQTFGDVPYINSTNYNVNKMVGKMSSEMIINKAKDDLLLAESLLKEIYPTSEKVRINKVVVQGFLARIYLYMQDWVNAQKCAEIVINNFVYQLEPIDKVFLKESKSAIWQFKPSVDGGNTTEAYAHIFSTVPAPNFQLSSRLLNSFSENDLRVIMWINFLDENKEIAHASKYKVRGSTNPSKEYSIVLRLEEMYLISAEAAAHLNQWSLFNSRLNALRIRTNLEELNINSLNQAMEVILDERYKEFFCEYGHRFYDLKRTNRLNILLDVKSNWQEYFKKLPIPEDDLKLNPNLLPQNEGY